MTQQAKITALYRYPVKGFSGEPVADMHVAKGEYVPYDRLYSIENGPTGFNSDNPAWLSKTNFLVLMTLPKLAELVTRFDEATSRFTLRKNGAVVVEGLLDEPQDRARIETFLADFLEDQNIGTPKILKAPPGFRFTDSTKGFISIVNRNTLRAIEKEAGEPLDPLRFRANVVIDDLPAFAEHQLVGKTLTIGNVVLRGSKPIVRCAATTVNLETARRDVMVPAILQRVWGHADCGLYCSIREGGTISPGDRVEIGE